MFFAVIGDIQSNFSGLKHLLTTLENEGIQRVLHTGNICNVPENARECVELLQQHGVLCIQGKEDRTLTKTTKHKQKNGVAKSLHQTHAVLGSRAIEFLNGLRRKRVFTEEGLRILMCHGAVNSAGDILSATTSVERFRRERELDTANIIVCGGASDPFAYNIEQTLFVCPGTMTDESGRPRYTLVNTENTPWETTSVVL